MSDGRKVEARGEAQGLPGRLRGPQEARGRRWRGGGDDGQHAQVAAVAALAALSGLRQGHRKTLSGPYGIEDAGVGVLRFLERARGSMAP